MIASVSAPFGRLWPATGRRRARRAWRRALAGRPRMVALSAVAAAFAGGVHLAPSFAVPVGEHVVVAAADLPAGHQVQDGDLVVALWPNGGRPAGVLARPRAGCWRHRYAAASHSPTSAWWTATCCAACRPA